MAAKSRRERDRDWFPAETCFSGAWESFKGLHLSSPPDCVCGSSQCGWKSPSTPWASVL